MDLIKRSLLVIVLLFVVGLAWVGFSIYFESSFIEINPNASSYTGQLRTEFDIEELDILNEKAEENLPVTPESFLSLVESD